MTTTGPRHRPNVPEFVKLDGSQGEGGGQILRTALSLSMTTGRAVEIDRVRARRPKPGLMRQHLAAVMASRTISGADVAGAELRSGSVRFAPGRVRPGRYHFDVGTAGSACLVLQTILPPLLTASSSSFLTIEGGTHNPHAPSFDFLDRVVLPLVSRMGPRVTATLERHGFPPKPGQLAVEIHPTSKLAPLELLDAGPVRGRSARSIVSRLPSHVAERELAVVRDRLAWSMDECHVESVEADSPGNVLLLEVSRPALNEMVTGFGSPGLPAERVAEAAVAEMHAYLEADVPVGRYLADQLLLLLALAGGGGSFRTVPLSEHARTNIAVIEAFGAAAFRVRDDHGAAIVEVVASAEPRSR
jgi:RNA 3'-terminal phosphate cyclase (ATP)